jgi:uncharacterized membrane protein
MKFLIKHIILFLIGGCIYSAIEISARGYTHPSMFILGGLCFICIGWLNEFLDWNEPLSLQMLAGGTIITFLEMITGFYVNIYKGWHVWDYTDMPFNFMGQICLPFSLMWCLLSLIGILIDDYIRYKYFGEEKPKYRII